MTKSVTSAEFQRAFGRYREAALREPVTITNHGRDSLVLMAADEYQRLKARDRQALYVWELDEETLAALAEDPGEDGAEFDHEMKT